MKPEIYYQTDCGILYNGDVIETLKSLPDESVNCVVTSPPYWGLRDYGVDGQIGLESTIHEFLEKMVEIFREVKRVLRSDGTCWINMGDCYSDGKMNAHGGDRADRNKTGMHGGSRGATGLRPKNLVGQPWRLAFALQDDGWYLRRDIIWHKKNPMPESATDRPSCDHEYMFLMTKSAKYFYDAEAVREPASKNTNGRGTGTNPKAQAVPTGWETSAGSHNKLNGRYKPKQNSTFNCKEVLDTRHKRTVWSTLCAKYPGAHYATFPPELISPCIEAGCPKDGVVMDIFNGTGTTIWTAEQFQRKWIGIDIDPAACKQAVCRLNNVTPVEKESDQLTIEDFLDETA